MVIIIRDEIDNCVPPFPVPTLYPRGPVCVPFPSPRAALHLEPEGLVEGLVDASTEQTLGSAFGLRRETDTTKWLTELLTSPRAL